MSVLAVTATPRPWWQTSLIVAGVAMAFVGLTLFLPLGRATVILVAGAVVFVWTLWHNPAFWLRRLASVCVSSAILLGGAPVFSAALNLGSLGAILVEHKDTTWLALGLLVVAVVAAVLEVLRERASASSPETPAMATSSSTAGIHSQAQGDVSLRAQGDIVGGDKHVTLHGGQLFTGPVTFTAPAAPTAATPVELDLQRHGLEDVPSPDPPNRRFDTADYVAALERRLAPAVALLPRTAVRLGRNTTIIEISCEKDAPPFALTSGEVYLLQGWSGRGKTSFLNMLARQALHARPRRLPIFVAMSRQPQPLMERILIALGRELPQLTAEFRVHEWLQANPVLLIVDNWHILTDDARRKLDEDLCAVARYPTATIIAGSSRIFLPGKIPAATLELQAYRDGEYEQHISRFFSAHGHRPYSIEQKAAPGLAPLLREPIILAKYLELLQIPPIGAIQPPHNVPELMEQLLCAVLQSHPRVDQRVAELSAVGRNIASTATSITLETIERATHACGIQESAAELADALITAGILQQPRGGCYEFTHDIWRNYFSALSLFNSGTWTDLAALQMWVRETEESTLRAMLPFVTGLVDHFAGQDALFDSLLGRDLELYFSALRTRAAARHEDMKPREWLERCLEQIHRGYYPLVSAIAPDLEPQLDPWRFGDGTEHERGEKPIVAGILQAHGAQYYHGFASRGGNDVHISLPTLTEIGEFTPSRGNRLHMVTIESGVYGADAGRVRAADDLLKQIRDILKEEALPPIGWLARERLRSLLLDQYHEDILLGAWEDWTVDQVAVWVRSQQDRGVRHVRRIHRFASWRGHGRASFRRQRHPQRVRRLDPEDGRELLALTSVLSSEGLAMTTVADLALPGSDADEADDDRAMELKVMRLTAFFDAVACTYRKLCEVVFAGVREHFLFAQFPCRTVVHYYSTTRSPFSLNMVWYWDVVESWAETTTIVHLRPKPCSQEFELLAANQRSLCARLGRRYLEFSVHHTSDSGMWSAWEPLVTHAVYGLLLDDINRLIKMVPDRHR